MVNTYFGVKIILLTNRIDFMLLRSCQGHRNSFLLIAGLWLSFLSCKSNSSTEAVHENPYIADFEPPAQQWGYIDNKGQLVIEAQYDAVSQFSQGLAAVNVAGQWGYIDKAGNMIIEPSFHEAWNFHDGLARVKPFDQPEHFVDRSGGVIRSADWEAEDDFAGGLARIRYGEKFGFVDTSGLMVINPDFDRAWNMEHGVAVVEKSEKVGVINAKGHVIIPLKYQSITRSLDGDKLFAHEGVKAIAYNTAGKAIVQLAPAKMFDADSFNIAVKRGDAKWLYNLKKRNWQPDHGFIQLINLGESRWAAKGAGGYQLLDKDGLAVNDKYYSQLNRFSSGIAAFQRDEYWGYVTVDGVELMEPQFGLAWDFVGGMARAAFRDGIGFITSDMQLAFYPPENTTDMRDFSEGLAPVQIAK
jgi:hypothetical protein